MTETAVVELQDEKALRRLEKQFQAAEDEQHRRLLALDRLLIWRIVQDDGISDDLLQTIQLERSTLEKLVDENEELYRECVNLRSLNAMLDLNDLFELARARVSQLLSGCMKATELRTLINCLRSLPGAKSLLAACDRAQAAAEELLASRPDSANAAQVQSLSQGILAKLDEPELNRQQRRSLERKLRKLQRGSAC